MIHDIVLFIAGIAVGIACVIAYLLMLAQGYQ